MKFSNLLLPKLSQRFIFLLYTSLLFPSLTSLYSYPAPQLQTLLNTFRSHYLSTAYPVCIIHCQRAENKHTTYNILCCGSVVSAHLFLAPAAKVAVSCGFLLFWWIVFFVFFLHFGYTKFLLQSLKTWHWIRIGSVRKMKRFQAEWGQSVGWQMCSNWLMVTRPRGNLEPWDLVYMDGDASWDV